MTIYMIRSLTLDVGPHLLLLVTEGLEDIAVNYLVETCGVLHSALQVLPKASISLGQAAIGRVVVTLHGNDTYAAQIQRIQEAGVMQAVLAFVAAAEGMGTSGGWVKEETGLLKKTKAASMPTGVLAQVADLVSSSPHWASALELLAQSGSPHVRFFRASAVSSGRKQTSFACKDVMAAMGGGVLKAGERGVFGQGEKWAVNLSSYDVEIFGTLCDGHFACGFLLGGQWRTNNEDNYKYGVIPFCETAGRSYREGHSAPHWVPLLRPSTAMLLLLFSGVQHGDAVIDPFGGSGSIAIEAATHFEHVTSITGDKDRQATKAAIENVRRAREHTMEGSSLWAYSLDAQNLSGIEDGSIDRYVADLPFGHQCRWDVAEELPKVLAEVRRVLHPCSGRCVLLSMGYRRIEQILADMNGNNESAVPSEDDCLQPQEKTKLLILEEKRNVGIGGYICSAIKLRVE